MYIDILFGNEATETAKWSVFCVYPTIYVFWAKRLDVINSKMCVHWNEEISVCEEVSHSAKMAPQKRKIVE